MHSILLVNAKGGCGKTTITTNLASYYASQGNTVAIADFDPQGSSIEWLRTRPTDLPLITGFAAWREAVRAPERPDYLIIDAPAGVRDRTLTKMVQHANTILIPVLPSPIDIRAAADFVKMLLLDARLLRDEVRVAVVANRVRENTVIYQRLKRFLSSLEMPFAATLRETQNYIWAAQRGLGVFDMVPSSVATDVAQWAKLIAWIECTENESSEKPSADKPFAAKNSTTQIGGEQL